MLALAGVVVGAVLADRDARLERALGVQADEFPFEESALSGFGLARRFQRGGFGLANDADFQPRVHESSRVHVEPRHGDGGGEEVSALVREDVQHLARDVRVLAVEVELVPDLDEEHHPGVFGFESHHLELHGRELLRGRVARLPPRANRRRGPSPPRVVAGARAVAAARGRERGELRDERVVARGRGRGDGRRRAPDASEASSSRGRGEGAATRASPRGEAGAGAGAERVGRLAPFRRGRGRSRRVRADRGAGTSPRWTRREHVVAGDAIGGALELKKDVIGFDADFFPAPGDLPDANRFIPPGPRGREAARAGSAGETRRGEDLSPRSK